MKSKKLALAALLGLVILPVVQAHAHGIWFAQRGGQLALIYGVGADDVELGRRISGLEGVAAYDSDFKPVKASVRVAAPLVLVEPDEPPTLVAAVLQNGIWARTEHGEFERKTLEDMPDAFLAERTIKYGVTIQGPLKAEIPALPGQTLQIIPVGPIPEKIGTPMTYRVLFNGKPVNGALMISDIVNDPDAVMVATRKDGTVVLPVRNQGLNVIRAMYLGPSPEPKKYHRIEHTATLAFTLAHEPE